MRYRAKFRAIGQTVPEIWRFFLFFKMAAAAILDFENVEILGVGRLKTAKVRHHVKFRVDRSNRCRDMAIFRFLKMAAAAILDCKNVEILWVGRLKTAKLRHRAKFRVDRSNRCVLRYGHFSIFPRWRLSAILDLW